MRRDVRKIPLTAMMPIRLRLGDSVEVAATSLNEAAVSALAAFHACRLAPDVRPGPATRLRVAVKAPETVHEISVGNVEAWLASAGKSPAEAVLKDRLRAMPKRP